MAREAALTEQPPSHSDRQLDGLNGKVLRVLTESASLTSNSGTPAEGPRVRVGETAYAPDGAKIAEEYYPVAGRLVAASEAYTHDVRGNISGKILRDHNGAILRREVYSYEFDALGNWTKMTTSVEAIVRGKVTLTPVEVTYRSITYSSEPVADNRVQPPSSPAPRPDPGEGAALAALPVAKQDRTVAEVNNAPLPSPPTPAGAVTQEDARPASEDARSAATGGGAEAANIRPDEVSSPAPASAEKRLVSGGVLRGMATRLPAPSYPPEASRARISGTVKVKVTVDEAGRVSSAEAVDGPKLLHNAAISAASKAHFQPTLLSGKPIPVDGIIEYHFTLDRDRRSLAGASGESAARKPAESGPDGPKAAGPEPEERKPAERAKLGGPMPPAAPAASESASRTPAPAAARPDHDPDRASVSDVSLYRVGVGDILDIRQLDQPTRHSTLYTVQVGGVLEYPAADKPMVVAGLTPDELRARLSEEIKRRTGAAAQDLRVSVREYVSHTVVVSGLVKQPGVKVLRQEAAPLFLVLAQAAPGEKADCAVITSGRTGESRMLSLLNPEALDTLIRPGDAVHLIARPTQYYYIGGDVAAPGRKDYHPSLTLTQAIMESGGITRPSSNKVGIRVSRQESDGRLTSAEYALADIERGKTADPPLHPGDRVTVGRRREE